MTDFYTTSHTPVMLKEVLEHLNPESGKVYIDGTFGAGGYSKAILDSSDCVLYCIDQDPAVEEFANKLKKEYGSRFKFIAGNFSELNELMSAQNIVGVDAIILDLGVSSMQLETPDRGFSFMHNGRLDMRMSKTGSNAYDFINTASEEDIANVIYNYGGETKSRRIAKKIVENRKITPIETTLELANIVRSVVKKGKSKIDQSTKTFQAIRIHVNDELSALKLALTASERLLNNNGKLIIVSFHSLEDAIVKEFVNERAKPEQSGSRYLPFVVNKEFKPTFKWQVNKAIPASEEEIRINPRSRSAKLRVAIRINQEVDYA
jgi:16S rRNA (cytosine1402-N4)-methyltransferase